MSQRRTMIVDFMHLAYKYTHGMGGTSLVQYVKMPDGTSKPIETNIQNGVSKAIHRWSRGGFDRTAICFDAPTPIKKQYFRDAFGSGSESAYKGGRRGGTNAMFEAVDMTCNLFHAAGVSCYQAPEYEADDLILACIEAAKREYPDDPIDVVTGDADLIPLVDEQVSVFMSSRKTTWAESKDLEKTKYFQIRPDNYEEFVSGLSMNSTSKLRVPYNTMLLIKLLRGDKSDNIPAPPSKAFPPRRVNDIIDYMEELELDIADEFRYGGGLDRITELLNVFTLAGSTGERYVEFAAENPEQSVAMFDPATDELDEDFLKEHDLVKDSAKDGYGGYADVSHIRKIYKGMNLNQEYTTDKGFRKPAKVRVPESFDEANLAKEFSTLGINLRLGAY